ncbi:unnamed product [Ostreococcus tauri]|uniref:Unnamed product n=1 Tax=Ostreococcus tauri TaxID=70448 RepID=Q01H74_OSTTA|nr:unnamed product [Ostreococcus tauri]OUS42958.1 hypothetical protein BE221DRAFT_201832 [Ostreococcus tauri]CAL49920.1 unnamed product [Ostreococcus tauri]|eukprot:XP_003074068.1 unnamed product [Ostreococcus tauri]
MRPSNRAPSSDARGRASSSRVSPQHSLPALWKHAMQNYGRYSGYAWTAFALAGGVAYVLSEVIGKKETKGDSKLNHLAEARREKGNS